MTPHEMHLIRVPGHLKRKLSADPWHPFPALMAEVKPGPVPVHRALHPPSQLTSLHGHRDIQKLSMKLRNVIDQGICCCTQRTCNNPHSKRRPPLSMYCKWRNAMVTGPRESATAPRQGGQRPQGKHNRGIDHQETYCHWRSLTGLPTRENHGNRLLHHNRGGDDQRRTETAAPARLSALSNHAPVVAQRQARPQSCQKLSGPNCPAEQRAWPTPLSKRPRTDAKCICRRTKHNAEPGTNPEVISPKDPNYLALLRRRDQRVN